MFLRSPLLESIPWLEHGFGTKQGPLSQDGMATLRQIHSSLSLVADRREGCVGEGDALLTRETGVIVSVRTADCFPILLADTANRGVAAVHAGWRGTEAQVLRETIRRMQTEFGTNPANVVASIGPGIGACCFEVGEDVARRFGRECAGHVDLAQENIQQLIAAGVRRDRISLAGDCTVCNWERFHSWRRDRESAGRMISFIGVQPPPLRAGLGNTEGAGSGE